MEIWLTRKGERLRLPITPTFQVPFNMNNMRENLNEVGTINIAGNAGLRTVSLESFFPSKPYYFIESSDVVLNPYYYYNKLENWARAGDPIRLIITETPFNFEVLIDSILPGEQDGTGDVYYTLELSEYVRVEATEAPVDETKPLKMQDIKRFEGQSEVPKVLKTVNKHDTSWTMAKKLTGDGKNANKLLKQNKIKRNALTDFQEVEL